ncbi:hypothetical protein PMG11_04528 [Penicillium brasilianum]|uniref:Methyltransferase type 11 domain-containing protein n=1 Tax=Penicillium brasilianum TaxID=104259 RepID=A0A0F7VD01_PENBI|nr:hypothetical protein PMG11_04528 [Penicillium brasilianum]
MTDFTEANRAHFDQTATAYQSKFADSLKIIAAQTLKHRLWVSDRWTDTEAGKGQEVKLLEYACGPGVVSMTLAPFSSKVIGIDVSEQMVAEFNRNAQAIGLSDKMIGYKADLLTESAPEEFSGPDYTEFDVLVISLALHHFEYPDVALQRLARRLKKGGSIMIIDLIPSSEQDHGNGHSQGHHGHGHGHAKEGNDFGDASHLIKTHGFSREDLEKIFKDAGLGAGFDYELIPDQLIFEKGGKTIHKTIFIARAQRI